jgi:hypothetical protein
MFTAANSELQYVITEVVACFNNLMSSYGFYQNKIESPIDFLKFKNTSLENALMIKEKLICDWPLKISSLIQENLAGYFDFQEKNIKRYIGSRCRSFLSLVTTIMESQVFMHVIKGYGSFLKNFAVRVEAKGKPQENEVDRGNNLIAVLPNPASTALKGIFIIYISIMCFDLGTPAETLSKLKVFPKNEIILHPSLEELKNGIIELFECPSKYIMDLIPTAESLVMQFLDIPGSQYINTSNTATNEFPISAKPLLIYVIESAFPKIEELLNRYRTFEFLVKNNEAEQLGSAPLDSFLGPVVKLKNAISTLQSLSDNIVELPPFLVDCSLIKKICTQLAHESLNIITDNLSDRIEKQCRVLLARYEPLAEKLRVKPGLAASWWMELSKCIESANQEVGDFNQKVLKNSNIVQRYTADLGFHVCAHVGG